MSRVVPLIPPPSSDDLEQLITPEEAAALLKVPPSWVYQHATPHAKNRLPYLKIGRYTRFRESELRTWQDRQRKS